MTSMIKGKYDKSKAKNFSQYQLKETVIYVIGNQVDYVTSCYNNYRNSSLQHPDNSQKKQCII